MHRDDQEQRSTDLEDTKLDPPADAEDELDDEDLESVAGGWSGEGDGGG